MNTTPKRLPRTAEQRARYWTMLLRIADDEKVSDEEFFAAMEAGGWERGKPNDYIRDISLVRLERAAREATAQLPDLLAKSKGQRISIREKAEKLDLSPPYIHGDTEGNIVTRHHQLRAAVAEHAKTVQLIKQMERDERQWRQDAPELAARRAGRAVRS